MPLSEKRRQIAIKAESSEGTAETLTASEAAFLLVGDFSYELLPEFEAREIIQASKSTHPDLVGIEMARIGMGVELRGSGSESTAPGFGTLLQAASFGETAVKKIAVGAISGGPFEHGETITGGTSSGTGRVVGQYATGVSHVYYVPLSGTLQDAETLTGGTSSATATSSSDPADGGYVYEPVSTGDASATMAMYHDGIRKLLVGCRANVTLGIAGAGKPAILRFTFDGVHSAVADVALLSGITHETALPPVMKNGVVRIGSYTPIAKAFDLDMQNQVSLRTSFAASKGAISARIPGRDPRGNLQIETDLVANYDAWGNMIGETIEELEINVGSSAGNRFKIICPQFQITGTPEGDENLISTLNLGFKVPGGTSYQDREISILAY